jgi:hypothetical protein
VRGDSRRVAAQYARDVTARLWDADSGTELLRSSATTDKSPFDRISGIASRENG